MALLIPRFLNKSPLVVGQISKNLAFTIYRSHGGAESQVGEWPSTKEERLRAAKKYNLIPEDYEPYDIEEGCGDYPHVKAIGAFNKDWYDDYDDPDEFRHYGEVWQRNDDIYEWEKLDPLAHEKKGPKWWVPYTWFFGTIIIVPTIFWLADRYKIHFNQPYKKRYFFPKDYVFYEFPRVEGSSSHGHH